MRALQMPNGIAALVGVTALAAGILMPLLIHAPIHDVATGALIIPPASPVQYAYDDEYDGGVAHVFAGAFVVSGTYYYGYEDQGAELSAFIVPDKASAAVLPYWKRWGPPERIDLANIADFAKDAVPAKEVAEIAARRVATVSGHIVIVARDYEVTGECDRPIYLAKFQSVSRAKDMIAAVENTITNCG